MWMSTKKINKITKKRDEDTMYLRESRERYIGEFGERK